MKGFGEVKDRNKTQQHHSEEEEEEIHTHTKK